MNIERNSNSVSDSEQRTFTELHDANRRSWDASTPEWTQLDEDGWRRCKQEPQIAFEGHALETILASVGSLSGKRGCIVGSGDNYAAFALAGLGAEVISADISEKRLQVAAGRAAELGLQIRFLRADAADLSQLADSSFDLVCSTNGFFVWLATLGVVFAEIARILRPGGHYVFYDVHPFQRPWKDQVEPVEMIKSYWDRSPGERPVDDTTYRFHWTMADIINALAGSGLSILKVIESPARDSRFWQGPSYGSGTDDRLQDWKQNPRAGLPVWLTVAAEKRS